MDLLTAIPPTAARISPRPNPIGLPSKPPPVRAVTQVKTSPQRLSHALTTRRRMRRPLITRTWPTAASRVLTTGQNLSTCLIVTLTAKPSARKTLPTAMSFADQDGTRYPWSMATRWLTARPTSAHAIQPTPTTTCCKNSSAATAARSRRYGSTRILIGQTPATTRKTTERHVAPP